MVHWTGEEGITQQQLCRISTWTFLSDCRKNQSSAESEGCILTSLMCTSHSSFRRKHQRMGFSNRRGCPKRRPTANTSSSFGITSGMLWKFRYRTFSSIQWHQTSCRHHQKKWHCGFREYFYLYLNISIAVRWSLYESFGHRNRMCGSFQFLLIGIYGTQNDHYRPQWSDEVECAIQECLTKVIHMLIADSWKYRMYCKNMCCHLCWLTSSWGTVSHSNTLSWVNVIEICHCCCRLWCHLVDVRSKFYTSKVAAALT